MRLIKVKIRIKINLKVMLKNFKVLLLVGVVTRKRIKRRIISKIAQVKKILFRISVAIKR